jgi:hypothetical protein
VLQGSRTVPTHLKRPHPRHPRSKLPLRAPIAAVPNHAVAVAAYEALLCSPPAMAAAVAALLGGIVVWGSNGSTAKDAAKQLATAEADRAALIEKIDLRVIP